MMIETMEGATSLDESEIDGLLLTHITTRDELDRWEQDNILSALGWLAKTKKIDLLTEEFIRILHRRMFGEVWDWAGQFRKTNKNLGIDWWQIPTSLRDLLEDASLWIEADRETPEEIAVRFHHRLVAIHPFPNGNGRHARLMADLILERLYQRPRLSWGGNSNLTRTSEIRRTYIRALRAADEGDFNPLVAFARS